MKQIIVPTDFSDLSQKGLELAVLLTNNIKANIQLVHVAKFDAKHITLGKEKILLKNITHELTNIIEKIHQSHPNIDIEYIIKEGKVHDEIINQANAFNNSFIVTSTHGTSGWEELFIGSNAYKIVASSSKPVFTLRGETIPKQIKNIVLPLDNTLETLEKVPFTAELAKLLGAQVHIVTVTESELKDIKINMEAHARQVKTYLNKYNIVSSIDHITGNNITDITIEYAKKQKADLISVMTEQERSISNILLGSYAHQMINKSPIPVLLFPTKQIGLISDSFKAEGVYY